MLWVEQLASPLHYFWVRNYLLILSWYYGYPDVNVSISTDKHCDITGDVMTLLLCDDLVTMCFILKPFRYRHHHIICCYFFILHDSDWEHVVIDVFYFYMHTSNQLHSIILYSRPSHFRTIMCVLDRIRGFQFTSIQDRYIKWNIIINIIISFVISLFTL